MLWFIIPTNKAILPHNRNMTINIMKLTLIYHCHLIHRLHSSSTSCPDNILYSRRTQTRITYGTEFSSLFSFLPSWTVSSSVFLDISFLDSGRLQAGYSVELLSVWVCLMCLHDYIPVVAGIVLAGIPQKQRSVFFASHQVVHKFNLSHSWWCFFSFIKMVLARFLHCKVNFSLCN